MRLPTCPRAREALTCFTNIESRMDYAHCRQPGLQLGSGTTESARKQVVEARLKRGRWEETFVPRPKPARTFHSCSPA